MSPTVGRGTLATIWTSLSIALELMGMTAKCTTQRKGRKRDRCFHCYAQIYVKAKEGAWHLTGEIVLLDHHVVAYRNNLDVFFYVVGSLEENELILLCVLDVFYNALAASLR